MKRSTKIGLAALAATGMLVVGGTTGAVAAKLITGDDIAKSTITARNLAPNSVGSSELKPGVVTEEAGIVDAWTEVTPYSDITGARVTPVDGNGGGGDSEVTVLRFFLDEGTYLVDATTQFFRGDPNAEDYGVATLYVDGTNIPGTVFTGDLTGSTETAAQAGGTQLVTITEADTEVEVRASVRGELFALVGSQAVITQLAD